MNLGVLPKPPNEPKRRPYLKNGVPDQIQIHYSTKRGNSSEEFEILEIETEGKIKW
jgi:hypothetical protein